MHVSSVSDLACGAVVSHTRDSHTELLMGPTSCIQSPVGAVHSESSNVNCSYCRINAKCLSPLNRGLFRSKIHRNAFSAGALLRTPLRELAAPSGPPQWI